MSNMKIAFAAVAALGLLAGAAYAKTPVTAKIANAVAGTTEVIAPSPAAGTAVWSCTGDTCVTELAGAPTARACKALARKVGTVVSFTGLDEADLARCNGGVASRETTSTVAQR